MTQLEKPRLSWLTRLWKELLEPILFAVLITQFIGTIVGVDGVSMMPNLRHHERVFVPKYETWLHKVGVGSFQRGDILIFKPPAAAESKTFFGLWNYRPFLIKRLIGLPGDKLSISGGVVSINGVKLDGSFTTDFWKAQGCWDTQSVLANQIGSNENGIVPDRTELTVPAGQYFLMGDNRTATGSEDSRLFGPVPLRDIAGRAAAVIWPIMRQQNASYKCSQQLTPDQMVDFSGKSVLNLRALHRPAAFNGIPAP